MAEVHRKQAESINWLTPKFIIDLVKKMGDGVISLDAASNDWSLVGAEKSIQLPTDSLSEDWTGYRSTFLNPPFGISYLDTKNQNQCYSAKEFKELKEATPAWDFSWFKKQRLYDWVKKCVDTDEKNRLIGKRGVNGEQDIFLLIPADLSTSHFRELIFPTATAICYFSHRVRYVNPLDSTKLSSPPMGSALIFWGTGPCEFERIFKDVGHVEIL
jgi:hypothetical protein